MADSFFGFNTTLPRDASPAPISFGDSDDIDARLEGQERTPNPDLVNKLDEANDDLNDETFGCAAEDVSKDFDFAGNTNSHAKELLGAAERPQSTLSGIYHSRGNGQNAYDAPAPLANFASSDTTARLRGRSPLTLPPGFDQPTMGLRATSDNINASGAPAAIPKKMLSMEEVERALIESAKSSNADRERQRVREQRRVERERRMANMARYNNLMTRADKNFVQRVQISQLLTDDPYADDFYCQMYTVVRNPGLSMGHNALGEMAEHYGGRHMNRGGMHRLQQQIQRMVSDAKRKPKGPAKMVEGALGAISFHSVRNPKQAISVAGKPVSTSGPGAGVARGRRESQTGQSTSMSDSSTQGPSADRRQTLMRVEQAFRCILKLEEQLRTKKPFPGDVNSQNLAPAGQNNAAPERDDSATGPEQASTGNFPESTALASETESLRQELWDTLEVVPPVSDTLPHPLIRFLSVSKGKKLIPRTFHYLSPNQAMDFVTALVANFESMDVCRGSFGFGLGGTLSTTQSEETMVFLNAVLPPVVAVVGDAPLSTVNALLTTLLLRNNVPWIARSKAGLALLTVLISRGEMLKQQSLTFAGATVTSQEQLVEFTALFNQLFNVLQSHFSNLFPPTSGNGASPVPDSFGPHQHTVPNHDLYVWQFLATVAVGASPDQQHILVSEVREKVMEQVALASNHHFAGPKSEMAIANVNLLLHALGLDASQLLSH
ncbi:DNA topoisomerase 2-associated protein pat1 [Dispira parvispora]|uniref:DNA topoisomerase 2-associated protein pat1 n=1 Tax=Dispira parvispora TaxID=1520584 RepID=A0A9W8E7D9_9FUNG|nr:DNA topoisomerase 2-associated protein pat1 [Dispira parvispora]